MFYYGPGRGRPVSVSVSLFTSEVNTADKACVIITSLGLCLCNAIKLKIKLMFDKYVYQKQTSSN